MAAGSGDVCYDDIRLRRLPEFARDEGQIPKPSFPGRGVDCFGQGSAVEGSNDWGAGFPKQGVVTVGVDYVKAAEVLCGEAVSKVPVLQPGVQRTRGSVGENGAHIVTRICRTLVSGKDGYRVTTPAQGVGQSMRSVGHSATLGAAGRGQMRGQLSNPQDDRLFRLRRPARYPRQSPCRAEKTSFGRPRKSVLSLTNQAVSRRRKLGR